MRRNASHTWITAFGLVAFLVPALARASIPGQWMLEMSGTLEGEEAPCVFRGTADLSPAGPDGEFDFSGPGHLDLESGPESCAPSLDGVIGVNVTVSAEGLQVSGQIDGGQALGLANFTGLVVGDPTGSGTFSVISGPFAGFNGTWSGILAAVFAIPTLQTTGLVLMAALLAVASALALRRRASGAAAPEPRKMSPGTRS